MLISTPPTQPLQTVPLLPLLSSPSPHYPFFHQQQYNPHSAKVHVVYQQSSIKIYQLLVEIVIHPCLSSLQQRP
ncbi:hypothetical protein E2C01_096900 [Portunus trituberculatus]|uniref:Uncharacterized protein n=1 Tax=Portunus trituberculatus TaxID=210409 RepID=A0A5B7K4B2_PORTR|nr:hypothetical protein [Portunus trituberculatus]